MTLIFRLSEIYTINVQGDIFTEATRTLYLLRMHTSHFNKRTPPSMIHAIFAYTFASETHNRLWFEYSHMRSISRVCVSAYLVYANGDDFREVPILSFDQVKLKFF